VPTHDPSRQVRIVPATVHGRYLVRPPAIEPGRGWLVGFHGQGQTADVLFDSLRFVPGAEEWRIVSVQALHPYYTRSNQIVAGWMTRLDREHAIADNVAYVDAVLADLERSHGPPPPLVFVGFSQGAAMAYRAGVLGRHRAAAIVSVGGDLPPDLATATDRPWPVVLACTGGSDPHYTPARLEADLAILRRLGVDARPLVFDGGHEWTDAVAAEVGRLLQSLGRG
jgi:predicted esterase